jgi:hypothetical protein
LGGNSYALLVILSLAVPIVFPVLVLSVNTAMQEPDVLPQTAEKLLPDPEIVAMPFDMHVLSLKVNLPPFGPFVVTVCSGFEADRWIEHGFTETPLSTLQAKSIGAPAIRICDAVKGSAFEGI